MAFFKNFTAPAPKLEVKAAGSLDALLGGPVKIVDIMTDAEFLAKKGEILAVLVDLSNYGGIVSETIVKILPPIQKPPAVKVGEFKKTYMNTFVTDDDSLANNNDFWDDIPAPKAVPAIAYPKAKSNLAQAIERHSVTIEVAANDEGYIVHNGKYDEYPVSEEAIAAAVNLSLAGKGDFGADDNFNGHFGLKPSDVQLKREIKELGLYTISVKTGMSEFADLKVWVVPKEVEYGDIK
jgi:hypothetical protein